VHLCLVRLPFHIKTRTLEHLDRLKKYAELAYVIAYVIDG